MLLLNNRLGKNPVEGMENFNVALLTLANQFFSKSAEKLVQTGYTLIARNLLLSRCFKRAARLLWCNPLVAALSMVDTAARYALAASSTLFSVTFFKNFLIDERNAERWLMLWMRRFALCRARFLACGEFAKIFPLRLGSIRWTREYGQFGGKSQAS